MFDDKLAVEKIFKESNRDTTKKEDFQRLLDHIESHPELFEGLRIRQV